MLQMLMIAPGGVLCSIPFLALGYFAVFRPSDLLVPVRPDLISTRRTSETRRSIERYVSKRIVLTHRRLRRERLVLAFNRMSFSKRILISRLGSKRFGFI